MDRYLCVCMCVCLFVFAVCVCCVVLCVFAFVCALCVCCVCVCVCVCVCICGEGVVVIYLITSSDIASFLTRFFVLFACSRLSEWDRGRDGVLNIFNKINTKYLWFLQVVSTSKKVKVMCL